MNNQISIWRRYALSLIGCMLLAAGLCTSCDRSVYYSDEQSVDVDGWSAADAAQFDIDIKDTTVYYDFYVDLRNSADYGFANCFLFINTTFPDGSRSRDTLECPMADPTGAWYGKTSGNYVDNRYYFRSKVRFPQVGTYHFEVLHGMRDPDLKGIAGVGLRLEYTQSK